MVVRTFSAVGAFAALSLAIILLMVSYKQPALMPTQPRYFTAPAAYQSQTSYSQGMPPSTITKSSSTEDPGVRHSRLKLIWGLIGEVWGWIVLAAIVFGGLSPRLRDFARRLTGGRIGSLSPYVILLSVLLAVLNGPITYYNDYVIEHQFGLSNQNFWSWLGDSAKSLGVGIVISLIVFNLVYWLVRRSPRRWWPC